MCVYIYVCMQRGYIDHSILHIINANMSFSSTTPVTMALRYLLT